MMVMSTRGSYKATLASAALMWFVTVCVGVPDPRQRDLIMRQEASRQTGGRMELTAAERRLDSHLHMLKEQEMTAVPFLPAMHFFKAQPLIQKSKIFSLLQKMPKGDIIYYMSSNLPDIPRV